jgi:hypothetical protein
MAQNIGRLVKGGTRQDTFLLNVKVTTPAGAINLGAFDKKSGGELDSDEVTYYPGGMVPRISLGGRVTPGNVTLQRIYDRFDDHAKIGALLNAVGKGTVTVTQRPMDIDGNVFGQTGIQWIGVLKRVQVPDVDSEATSAALLEIEVTVHGNPEVV